MPERKGQKKILIYSWHMSKRSLKWGQWTRIHLCWTSEFQTHIHRAQLIRHQWSSIQYCTCFPHFYSGYWLIYWFTNYSKTQSSKKNSNPEIPILYIELFSHQYISLFKYPTFLCFMSFQYLSLGYRWPSLLNMALLKKYIEYHEKEIIKTQTRTLTLITHTGLYATRLYCLNQLKCVHSEKDKAQVMI